MRRAITGGLRWRGSAPASANVGQWLEAVLFVILLLQIARLIWSAITPVGLFGDWQSRKTVVVNAEARHALFAGFDPFFRTGNILLADSAAQQVTSLPLQLFGVRVDEISGQGSAIIANGSGEQYSYAVGDEIVPGVTLKAVMFDHVVIDRGGVSENIFIDQSDTVAATSPGNASEPADDASPTGAQSPNGPLTPQTVMSDIGFTPRTEGGKVTGIVVRSQGNGFAKAGFKPGDIISQINGQAITSASDLNDLQSALRPGARISVMVERGAATVPVAIILDGK